MGFLSCLFILSLRFPVIRFFFFFGVWHLTIDNQKSNYLELYSDFFQNDFVETFYDFHN